MRLLRFGPRGRERPGLLDEQGSIRDLSAIVSDIDALAISPAMLERIAAIAPASLPLVEKPERLGPPVAGVSKFIGVGLNYRDHAIESGLAVPDEPVLFLKASSCISGPSDPILLPPGSTKTDWEVELGLVIGTVASRVSPEQALEHVAGYLVVNDVSEREYQWEKGSQWTKGKCCDSFGPLGPWLVTKDEVPDPQNLNLWLDVNGQSMQRGNTRTMVFSCAEIVSYTSMFMSLQPGDIISTGTPPGVGMGRTPQIYLRRGDIVRLGIDGLGEQTQTVIE